MTKLHNETKIKSDKTHADSGRSMIEMIGVLAIIGVLSVGALSGYRMAMTQYRANEIVDYIMRVGEGALHHGNTQKTGSIPYSGSTACPRYVNGEEPPFGMTCYSWNHTAGNDIPVAAFYFTNWPSADVARAVDTRIGRDTNKPVFFDSLASFGCPSTNTNSCIGYVFFKK